MGNGCGGNGNCCDINNVGDSNINRMAAGAAMMMTMTASAAAVATAVTMAVTMMVVAAVAEAASVAAPMVSAPQPHPNPQQYWVTAKIRIKFIRPIFRIYLGRI
jgi:hypothetical protein